MPFNLSSGASNLLLSNDDPKSAFLNSSFYTAVIITLLIIVIILVMYPCSKNATAWERIKTFAYIFVCVFFILVLHKGTIVKVLDKDYREKSSEQLLSNMGSTNMISEPMEVQPKPVSGGIDETSTYSI